MVTSRSSCKLKLIKVLAQTWQGDSTRLGNAIHQVNMIFWQSSHMTNEKLYLLFQITYGHHMWQVGYLGGGNQTCKITWPLDYGVTWQKNLVLLQHLWLTNLAGWWLGLDDSWFPHTFELFSNSRLYPLLQLTPFHTHTLCCIIHKPTRRCWSMTFEKIRVVRSLTNT